MMRFFGGYKAQKLKPQLKMAVTRFQIASNKKSALSKQQIREIAKLLAEQPNPKEEKARIKAEALIRDDDAVEAYEILQLTCDLLAERINLISHSPECPPDLSSSVSTLIWASTRVDVPELVEIRKQFRHKYGSQFEDDALANVGGILNERVVAKLSVQPPSAYLVQTYLEKIAEEHEVDWKPKVPLKASDMAEPMAAPVGYSVPVAGGSGLATSAWTDGRSGGADGDGDVAAGPLPAAPMTRSSTLPVAPMASPGDAAYVPLLPPRAPSAAPVRARPGAPAAPPPQVSDDDDIEEVDIFIPGAPKAPPGGGGGKRDDDDDSGGADRGGINDGGNGGYMEQSGGSSATDEAYDDLAARFATLQK